MKDGPIALWLVLSGVLEERRMLLVARDPADSKDANMSSRRTHNPLTPGPVARNWYDHNIIFLSFSCSPTSFWPISCSLVDPMR